MLNKKARTTASIASGILGTVAAACIIPLLHFEHTRSVRQSSLLSLYLIFSSLLDIPLLRTLELRGDSLSIIALTASVLLVKIVLLLLETLPKQHYLRPEYQHSSPESRAGIINRSCLWWLVGLFGLSNRGSLRSDNLYKLDPELASDFLCERMSLAWKKRGRLLYVIEKLHQANCYLKPDRMAALPLFCLHGDAFDFSSGVWVFPVFV